MNQILFNFAALAFNCKGYPNVTFLNKAVAHQVSKMTFFSDCGNIGSSIIRRTSSSPKIVFEVEGTTLDAMLAKMPSRTHLLLKLDLEGAEPLALQGMSETVERFSKITVVLEHNPQALRDGGFSSEDILNPLWSMGFVVWFIEELEKKLIHVDKLGSLPKGNLLAQKG